MKFLTAILLLVGLNCAMSTFVFNLSLDDHWNNFKRIYGKQYSCKNEGTRRTIWEKNMAEIIHHNLEYDLGKHSFRMGMNEFADMSNDEFMSVTNDFRRPELNNLTKTFTTSSNFFPEYVDWRKEGFVTPVKNQGQCGSVWAFSATGALEGQHAKKTGKLVSLSEQNLIDCAAPAGQGCTGGGSVVEAFEYVKKNGGIDTEDSYPLTGGVGPCRYNASTPGATCSGYIEIQSEDERALQSALAVIGPISVAIDASQLSFQLYSAGVYDEPSCSSSQLDHVVLAIGYGTDDGRDYWIVKNSWGKSWGENGYIRMSRNKNNQCGIASQAIYPLP